MAVRSNPDTLPITGYSEDQLKDYVKRQLGYPTWTVELTDQQIYDAINDAVALHGIWRPSWLFKTTKLSTGVYKYFIGEDLGDDVGYVSFVEPYPTPTEIFYGNLIDPAPILRTGLEDYDMFMRWRTTWQRVMSVLPDYYYDASHKVLYVHNPIARYHCTAFYYKGIRETSKLDSFGSQWVKEFALQKAKYTYGEILAKFSGAIPGPLKDLQLDQNKREQAQAQLTALTEQLKAAQVSCPVQLD